MAINFNGVRVRSSGAPPVSEPSPPTDSLGAWWRADDAGTVNGSNVTSWTDRTGYAQTLSTVGGVSAPTWQASVANLGNRPAVKFVANSGLRLSLPSGFAAGTTAMTVYTVLEVDTFPAGGSLPFCYGPVSPGTPGDHFAFFVVGAPNRVGAEIYFGSTLAENNGAAQILSARNPSNTQWANSFLTIDGMPPANISYANPTTVLNVPSPVAAVSVGGVQGYWEFRGSIAEILYYSKNQNGNERAQTLLYLSSRYGIALV